MRATAAIPRRAVILVAGVGSRLGQRTADLPKCLVEVNGVPILVNALARLEAAGIAETVLVTGYRQDIVRDRIGTERGRMRIAYRVNRDYLTTNTSRSLFLGLQDLDDDVIVIEGDVFFEQRVIDEALGVAHANVTVVEGWNPSLDGSVVEVGTDRHVRRWVHRKDRPPGFALEGTYKTVNIHRFSRAFVNDRLGPVLETMMDEGGGEPLETAFARIVEDGGRVFAAEAAGRWVEIDDESDLRSAEALFPRGGE